MAFCLRSLLLLLLLLLAFFQLSNALNSDGEALLALSSNLILPRSVNSTWNSSYPSPCGWAGISCNRGGFMTSFELPELQISGSLGKEIGLLNHLMKLDLRVNNLSGLIPSELGNCTLLEYLDLSNNFISGEIPMTLENHKKLSYLSLYNNSLSGQIPRLLFHKPSLETIYLNENNLNGSIPSFDENACRVKFLWLGKNNLSDSLPASISNCSELEELYLYANQLTGPIPWTINNLTEVDVSENDLLGNIPFNSKTCKLESLVMSFNRFDGELPETLGNCSNLKILAIVDNHLSGRKVYFIVRSKSNLKILPKIVNHQIYADASGAGKDVYEFVKAAGKFKETKRTEGISTSDLLMRIVKDYNQYVMRNLARGYTLQQLWFSFCGSISSRMAPLQQLWVSTLPMS